MKPAIKEIIKNEKREIIEIIWRCYGCNRRCSSLQEAEKCKCDGLKDHLEKDKLNIGIGQ